jgi:hypothetical protein
MLGELTKYFGALSVWINAEDKWKDVIGYLIAEYNEKYLMVLLNDCKESNPQAFNIAFDCISESLSVNSKELWDKFKGIK